MAAARLCIGNPRGLPRRSVLCFEFAGKPICRRFTRRYEAEIQSRCSYLRDSQGKAITRRAAHESLELALRSKKVAGVRSTSLFMKHEEPSVPNETWTSVATYTERVLAEAALERLMAENIASYIASDGYIPGLGSNFSVLVPRHLQGKANEILQGSPSTPE
jgi:hypothetical protein